MRLIFLFQILTIDISYPIWVNQLSDSDEDNQSTALAELPLPVSAARLLQPDQRLLEEETLCQADSQVDEGVIVGSGTSKFTLPSLGGVLDLTPRRVSCQKKVFFLKEFSCSLAWSTPL